MAGEPWLAYAAEAPQAEAPKPWEAYRAPPAANDAAPPQRREGHGVWDSLVAGYQGSATGLIQRGKLPDVVLDPHHAKWYEQAISSLSGTVSELPEMVAGQTLGTAAGAPLGAAAGSVIPGVGTGAGGVVGGLLGGGAGMMAVPTLIRESLIQAYESGQADSSADFLTRTGIVLKATGKSSLVGMATLGMGGLVGRAFGDVAAPLVGSELTGAAAARIAGTAGTSAEVGTMIVSSAALEGRLPEPQDFVNAAIVIGGMKTAGAGAGRLAEIYRRTGRTPEEVVADANADPKIAEELRQPAAESGEVPRGEIGIPKAYQPLAVAEAVRNAFPGTKAETVLDQPFSALPDTKLPYQVNLKYINGPEEVKGLLTKMSEVYSIETEAQRGGTQGWAETEAKAATAVNDLTGGDGAKVLTGRTPGSAANAVELKIRGDMLMQASIDTAAAVKTYNEAKLAGTATDQMKLDALAAIHRAAMIQSEFTGAAAETARALQYMQKIKDLRDQGERTKTLVEMYGKDPDLLIKMAGDMDTPAGMATFAKGVANATKWEMVVEAYKAGLIGPLSQMANIIGNVTFAAVHDIVDVVAAMRPGGEVTFSQAGARIIGQFQGAYEGLKIATSFIGENWTNPMQALRKLDEGPAVKQEMHRKAIPGDLGVLVRSLSFPWLSAMDGAFRMIAERGERNSWAAGEAAKEGLNPFTREFRERMAELSQNMPEDVQAKVTAFGTRAVFQDRLNPGMKELQSVINKSKVGPLFIPYIQTPTNVFKELARSFPLSAPFVDAWRADFKAGGAARDRAIAEVVVGSALMGVTAALAFDGERITGYGPPDPDKRSAWLETHQPYSVKINGTFHDYSRIQPIGTLIGLAADMSTIWKHMTPDEQDKIPKMISIAFSQAVTNQVWLKGLADMARGVAEPDRYGPKLVQNLAAGMVPGSGWLGQTAQLMDPYVREVNSIMDAIRNKIPGAREGLEPMVSGLTGKPIENAERLGKILPIKEKPAVEDKVLIEAARLGIGVSKAPKNIELPAFGDRQLGAIELAPEQKTLFSTEAGQQVHRTMTQVINSPLWETAADRVKRNIFQNAIKDARALGRLKALPIEQRIEKAQAIAARLAEDLRPK